MTTRIAEEDSLFDNPAVRASIDIMKILGNKAASIEVSRDAPPEDRIEPVDSIRAGVGAELLAQDGVSPETLARLSVFDLRILFDVYQGRFGQGDMVDYIGRVPASSILLGQGFKQLVDQGMAPADALNTTIWRLRGTEPAMPKPGRFLPK